MKLESTSSLYVLDKGNLKVTVILKSKEYLVLYINLNNLYDFKH